MTYKYPFGLFVVILAAACSSSSPALKKVDAAAGGRDGTAGSGGGGSGGGGSGGSGGAADGGVTDAPVQTGPADINGGVIAYWRFNEGAGVFAGDSSGKGNRGTLARFTDADWTMGYEGTGLQFDDSRPSLVVVPDSPGLNPTGTITIAAWIKAADWAGNRRIAQKGSNDNQYRLLAEDNFLKFEVALAGGGVAAATANLPITGQFIHVAGSYDGGTARLFIDGKLVGMMDAAVKGPMVTTADPLVIGCKNMVTMVPLDCFAGVMDELVMYDRALREDEIAMLAKGSFPRAVALPDGGAGPDAPTGPVDLTTGLAAYLTFNENSGTMTADRSGHGNNGTLTNFMPTDWQPGYQGSALRYSPDRKTLVVMADNPTLDPTAAITLAAWVNADNWNSNRRIAQKGTMDNQYRLLAEGGLVKFEVVTASGTMAVAFGAAPSTGRFAHLAGTYDGTTARIYVDGAEAGMGTATGPIAVTADPLVVGCKDVTAAAVGDCFSGIVDELVVYGRALAPQDVAALAAGTFPPAMGEGPRDGGSPPDGKADTGRPPDATTDGKRDGGATTTR
jgi:hypothetical protein